MIHNKKITLPITFTDLTIEYNKFLSSHYTNTLEQTKNTTRKVYEFPKNQLYTHESTQPELTQHESTQHESTQPESTQNEKTHLYDNIAHYIESITINNNLLRDYNNFLTEKATLYIKNLFTKYNFLKLIDNNSLNGGYISYTRNSYNKNSYKTIKIGGSDKTIKMPTIGFLLLEKKKFNKFFTNLIHCMNDVIYYDETNYNKNRLTSDKISIVRYEELIKAINTYLSRNNNIEVSNNKNFYKDENGDYIKLYLKILCLYYRYKYDSNIKNIIDETILNDDINITNIQEKINFNDICSIIHDGWAIATILYVDGGGTEATNIQDDYIYNESTEKDSKNLIKLKNDIDIPEYYAPCQNIICQYSRLVSSQLVDYNFIFDKKIIYNNHEYDPNKLGDDSITYILLRCFSTIKEIIDEEIGIDTENNE